MRKFEIFRYLKKFSILVFLVAMLGVIVTWHYTESHQKYTASAVIRYTNSEVERGLAPDGTKLDVNEIYSSAVISQAMEFLGENGPLNIIRSRCNVEEVITKEQQAVNDAVIEKGEKVTYFPDTYRVNLVVDGEYGEDYAKNALDAIMQSYCTYYSEKYVEQRLSLTPSAALLESGYDYYECVRILENDTSEMIDFLKKKKDDYPDFRASKTGYSYADLYEIYVQFKNYEIPELYATVLKGPKVKDSTVLKNHIANTIAQSRHNEEVGQEKKGKIEALIENYVQKNLGMPGELPDGDTVASDYIMNQIEDRGAGKSAETTYDGLILETVEIEKNLARESIDRAFNTEMLERFNTPATEVSADESKGLESLIQAYEDKLSSYFEIVSATGKELNQAVSTDYLKMISTVRVRPSINSRLYIMMALVFFFVVGCMGAVFLGRIEDIVLYMLYTDKKTGLPNSDKLNVYINSLADRLLPEDFSCIAVKIENLDELNRRYGYAVGDGVLSDFANIIKAMGDTEGVIGYNGSGKYDAFFEKCNEKKAGVILKILASQVELYNRAHPDYPIVFSAASETTTASGIYNIRELLRSAIAKLVKEENDDKEA